MDIQTTASAIFHDQIEALRILGMVEKLDDIGVIESG